MPKVKSNFAEKWARVTPQRTEDYLQGVQNPTADWATETGKSAANYSSGVQQAIANKQFEKGVAKSGTAKWQRKSTEIGAPRFGPGVQSAQAEYAAGFAPYAQTIDSTQLPPRFAKGDPRNLERVKVISMALRNKKTKGV